MRSGCFAERRGIVGDGVKRDTVLARSFEAARDHISLGVSNHEGGKRLLKRISRAVLLIERSDWHFVYFDPSPRGSLKDCDGIQL